jgi:CubicO group peptidase (beta-lactamase class C family)
MTKAVTSLAAMRVVERGKLQFNQPIGQCLAGLGTPL